MSDTLCSICLENEAKYTCPACNAKTCSATCVKRHKLHSECTGLPDPTKFIPNKELGCNTALVNRDYNYLLTLERKISLAKQDVKEGAKNVFKRNANQARNNKFQRLNTPNTLNAQTGVEDKDKRIYLVEKTFPHQPAHSIRRQNTLVIHLPPGMSRATQNKSGYDKKSGSYTWTIDWIPVGSDGCQMKSLTSFRIKEDQLLREALPITVLSKVFAPKEIAVGEFTFYLENCLKSLDLERSIIPLDPEKTLSDNLKDKVILEYPRIITVHGAEIWTEYVQLEDEIFKKDDESESSSDSSGLSDDSTSSSDDSSESLDLGSDDEPEELSSKLAVAGTEYQDDEVSA